jgi:hypothetical protein
MSPDGPQARVGGIKLKGDQMSRFLRATLFVIPLLALMAPQAAAHGSPKYKSVFDGIKPSIPGLKVQVLGFDNQYELVDKSGKIVVVYGYNHEPYARIRSDGTVEVNQHSPALYLNEDRFGTSSVPASASPKAAPLWKVQDKTGRFVWHDHRMHWMAHTVPPEVSDQHKKTKIFDYAIPLSVNGRPAKLTGTLYWIGTPKGAPTGAIVALIAIGVLAIAFVLFVRRRRRMGPSAPPSRADSARDKQPSDVQAW